MPKVSVVIPVKNRPREINDALNSVMAQTVRPIEVIVVDDGSTDDTVASVLQRQGDPIPIHVKVLGENRGGGYARNVGIDAAQGQWLALLDSDDRWAPSKIQRQLARVAGVQGDIVCFTNLMVDRNNSTTGDLWNNLPFVDGGDVLSYILAQHQAVQTSTLMMPAMLAKAVRFDERLRRHQDLDFVLRLHHRGVPFCAIAEPLVTYSADPAAVRVSKRKNAAPSLTWLEIASAYIERYYLSNFYAREVFEMEFEDAPMRALARLAGTVVKGHVSSRSAMRVAARQIVSDKIKFGLRSLVRR